MTPDEFRQRMAALPEPPADSHAPLWDYWRYDLWAKAQAEIAYSFMGWPCVYHTMLQNHWPDVVEHEYQAIKAERPAMLKACDVPNMFYPYDRHANTPYSRNLVHQAYHILQWEKATGRRIADLDMIIEFGGGYGAMSLVARRLGFHGSYFIQDLPEFELLQEFFLSNADPYSGTTFFSHGNTWIGDKPASLLIAGYSLSECPLELRDRFLDESPASSYLIWYSDRFEDFDNLEYFQVHPPQWYNGLSWKHWRAEHMPPATYYSVGWKV